MSPKLEDMFVKYVLPELLTRNLKSAAGTPYTSPCEKKFILFLKTFLFLFVIILYIVA